MNTMGDALIAYIYLLPDHCEQQMHVHVAASKIQVDNTTAVAGNEGFGYSPPLQLPEKNYFDYNLRAKDPSLSLSHYFSTFVLLLPNPDLNSCVNPEPQLKV